MWRVLQPGRHGRTWRQGSLSGLVHPHGRSGPAGRCRCRPHPLVRAAGRDEGGRNAAGAGDAIDHGACDPGAGGPAGDWRFRPGQRGAPASCAAGPGAGRRGGDRYAASARSPVAGQPRGPAPGCRPRSARPEAPPEGARSQYRHHHGGQEQRHWPWPPRRRCDALRHRLVQGPGRGPALFRCRCPEGLYLPADRLAMFQPAPPRARVTTPSCSRNSSAKGPMLRRLRVVMSGTPPGPARSVGPAISQPRTEAAATPRLPRTAAG